MSEIEAWKAFSSKVEERLLEKQEEGYEGWDGEYPLALLKQELTDDALLVERNEFDQSTLLDIAARSMMVHYRNK